MVRRGAPSSPTRRGAVLTGEVVALAEQRLALQQLEHTPQQFVRVKRCGDEVVAVGIQSLRPPCRIAGEQRLEPGLARPELAQRGEAVEGSRQIDGDDRQSEAPASNADRGNPSATAVTANPSAASTRSQCPRRCASLSIKRMCCPSGYIGRSLGASAFTAKNIG
jgi:hypothetical protein